MRHNYFRNTVYQCYYRRQLSLAIHSCKQLARLHAVLIAVQQLHDGLYAVCYNTTTARLNDCNHRFNRLRTLVSLKKKIIIYKVTRGGGGRPNPLEPPLATGRIRFPFPNSATELAVMMKSQAYRLSVVFVALLWEDQLFVTKTK